MIQKRNIEACEHAFGYWKQNTTHTEADRRTCQTLATQLMALIKAKAPAAEFLALEERCEAAGIDAMGHGGFGLHSAIIAVLSDLGV
ncbi:MAG TPA: hypothetical protein DCS97_13840 [Planctomycetes bacterium]|nr:hypothetical protein [Planctomycetota bacterium]